MKYLNGEMVYSFKEKEEVGERYFKYLFKEPEGCNIQEILKFLILFLKLISKEMNKTMIEEVREEELEKIVYSFQKGKSPGLDGFTIEFYEGFFELLKSDLLKVVRESQRVGKVLGALNSTLLALIPIKKLFIFRGFSTNFML